MIFNGTEKDYIVPLIGRRRSAWAPVSRNLTTVTGMPGAHLSHTDVQARVITVPILVKAKNINDLQKLKEDIAEWLVHDEPKELIFKDEPDRVYYALVDDELELDEIFSTGRGEITFICPDPFKYGPEKTVETTSDTFIVENKGTAETEPIFELEVLQPTTFAMVSNGEEYMMVGRPYDVDETPFVKYERVFYSDASSTVGWTQGTDVDGGIVAGTMQSNGTRFEAVEYGTGTLWHGPAIKTSLPEILTDFRMDTFIRIFHSNPVQVGRVEVYLLDVNNQVVGKVTLRDTRTREVLAFAEVRAGDQSNHHNLIYESGDRPGNWNNFQGIMRLEREGNVWRAYVAMVDTVTGKHHTRREVTWVDAQNKFTRNVAQVQVHMAQYGNHTPITGGVYSINIYKINQQQNGIPYIANTGDKITFDHVTGDCFINGEPVPFDFGAEFFTLKKGANTLTVMPENTFETSVKYRERYK